MARRPRQSRPNPRWHRFAVRQRGERWVACFPDPERTKQKQKGDRVYREPVEHEIPLRHPDANKTPAANADEAYQLAEAVYDWLERRRIEVRERAAVEEETLAEGRRVRWPVAGCIDDWVARPRIKESSRETCRATIKPFREFASAKQIQFLDELTFDHGLEYRELLQGRIDAGTWASDTANGSLVAAKSMLTWCRKKLRIPVNPFTIGEIEGFDTRRRSPPIRYLPPHDRARLLAACKTTQEKLIFSLTTLAGLRNAEVVHLRWGHFVRDVQPPELDVRHSEPDEDDPAGWDPKTGERVVAVYWPETVELLEQWNAETPHGRGAADPIVANPTTGKPYETLPKRFHQRLQRDTGLKWTAQVGRRIACSLMVVSAHRLTGEPWSQVQHEQHFGHSSATASGYYLDRHLNRVRRMEEAVDEPDTEASGKDDGIEGADAHPGFSLSLAKQLLLSCLENRNYSRNKLAREVGVSFNAIKKYFDVGKSIPAWYWHAIDLLTRPREV